MRLNEERRARRHGFPNALNTGVVIVENGLRSRSYFKMFRCDHAQRNCMKICRFAPRIEN